MRRGGVILNFSRDAIVDSAAVIEALSERQAASLRHGLPDSARCSIIPKVICLPHLGASTVEAEENCAVMVVDNVREFLENGNVTRSVNFPETVLQRTRAASRCDSAHERAEHGRADSDGAGGAATSTSPTC